MGFLIVGLALGAGAGTGSAVDGGGGGGGLVVSSFIFVEKTGAFLGFWIQRNCF